MNKCTKIIGGGLLAGVLGLTVYHVIHHELFCKYRLVPGKRHCKDCGHRKACQKYHRKKWQGAKKK